MYKIYKNKSPYLYNLIPDRVTVIFAIAIVWMFLSCLLKFVRLVANSVFEINNPYDLKLLTRFRLGLSHFRYYKLRHNFQDCTNPMCVCGVEIEITTHFLLPYPFFQCASGSFLTNIKKIDESILKKHDELITKTLLYGDDKFDLSCNKSIILH